MPDSFSDSIVMSPLSRFLECGPLSRFARKSVNRVVVLCVIMACAFISQGRNVEHIDYKRIASGVENVPISKLTKLAWNSVQRESYDSAAVYYSIVASRFSETLPLSDKRKCAIANANMGYIWLSWRMNATEAYPWLMKARAISSQNGFKDIEASVISCLGKIYFDYNSLTKAVEYYGETMKMIAESRDYRYLGGAMIDFVAASLVNERVDLLRDMSVLTKDISMPPDMPLLGYVKRLDESLSLISQGRAGEAAAIMRDAASIVDVSADKKHYMSLHHIIVARMWMLAGEYDKALTELQEMVDLASREGYYNLLEKGYTEMGECQRAKGNIDSMRNYKYLALGIRDSLFSATRFNSVKDLEIAGELQSLHEDVRNATRNADMHRHRIIWVGLASVVLLAALVGMIISHRRLRGAYREIFKRNMELSEMRPAHPEPVKTAGAEAEKGGSASAESEGFDADHGRVIFSRVVGVMETSREIYDSDFSVDRLASLVGERTKAVSQAINVVGGKNFNTLLGEFRVREACRVLANPESLRHSTMESVAEKVGYKSRTYFSKIFKDVTGLTPTQFAKQAKNEVGKV